MPEQNVAGRDWSVFWGYVAMSTVLGLIPASAIFLSLGWLPLWVEPIAAGYLWIFGLFLFLGISLASWMERNGSAIERRQRFDPRMRKWRRQFQEERALEAPEPEVDREVGWNPIALWTGRLCIVGIPVLLALSDWMALASLYGFVMLLGAATANDLKTKSKEKTEPDRRSSLWLIGRTTRRLFRPIAWVGRFVASTVAVTFWAVIGVISWLWDLAFGPGITRSLCESLERPLGLIYFVYSEPHQRDYFLGDGGLLQSFTDKVISRDWRAELRPMWEGLDWLEYREAPELRLLEHFRITRMRDHLPFVAVVSPLAGIQGFKASKAYRARRRDKGAALRKLEERIKKAADKAFGTVGT